MTEARSRLVAIVLLVLVALGGAGLAVAADRPQNEVERPELTWAADQAARPWLDAARAPLAQIDAATATVSRSGRDALAQLQALDVDGVRQSLAEGSQAALAADQANTELGTVVAESHAAVERWRLGRVTADEFERIDTATGSANGIVALWARIEDRATVVAELLDALARHEARVAAAATAAGQSRWADAVGEIEAAGPVLDEARATRDRLAPVAEVETLTDLLDRHAAHDAARLALYQHVEQTGSQSGDRFESLEAAAEQAQAALPSDDSALAAAIDEVAGTEIANALVELEQARGDILAALAVEGDS